MSRTVRETLTYYALPTFTGRRSGLDAAAALGNALPHFGVRRPAYCPFGQPTGVVSAARVG